VGFYDALELTPMQYISVSNLHTHVFYMSMIGVLSL